MSEQLIFEEGKIEVHGQVHCPVYILEMKPQVAPPRVILEGPEVRYEYELINTNSNTTFLDRLHLEYTQLTERLEKLDNFMNRTAFYQLNFEDQEDLKSQSNFMQGYAGMLGKRLASLHGKH